MFQRADSLLVLADFLPRRHWHPVLGAQVVEHRAAHAHTGIGLEFIAALQVVTVNGIQKTEEAAAQQIIAIDLRRQADCQPPCRDLDQRQIVFRQLITELHILIDCVALPKGSNIYALLLLIHTHNRGPPHDASESDGTSMCCSCCA